MNVRKHLNADSLIKRLRDCFKEISDHRAKNVKFSLPDVLMSGYAMFSLKCSSLLEFDDKRDDAEEMENIKHRFSQGVNSHIKYTLLLSCPLDF